MTPAFDLEGERIIDLGPHPVRFRRALGERSGDVDLGQGICDHLKERGGLQHARGKFCEYA